ncbi:hypothetical protein NDU88_002244 [Pleurodeles waltl]|uniref:Uncharacterized protein n=1 Tax=Pleurodeles waltl TaxID=8319 RepID=A0AAV7U8Q4_PLEWA|nr:hypothetical protein NDU88_002244 [Pleurodeles waltl]
MPGAVAYGNDCRQGPEAAQGLRAADMTEVLVGRHTLLAQVPWSPLTRRLCCAARSALIIGSLHLVRKARPDHHPCLCNAVRNFMRGGCPELV